MKTRRYFIVYFKATRKRDGVTAYGDFRETTKGTDPDYEDIKNELNRQGYADVEISRHEEVSKKLFNEWTA